MFTPSAPLEVVNGAHPSRSPLSNPALNKTELAYRVVAPKIASVRNIRAARRDMFPPYGPSRLGHKMRRTDIRVSTHAGDAVSAWWITDDLKQCRGTHACDR